MKTKTKWISFFIWSTIFQLVLWRCTVLPFYVWISKWTASESDCHMKVFLPFSLAYSSWRYRMNCGLQLLIFPLPFLFLEPRRPVNHFWNHCRSEVLERGSYCSENKSSRTWLSLTCPCQMFWVVFFFCTCSWDVRICSFRITSLCTLWSSHWPFAQ